MRARRGNISKKKATAALAQLLSGCTEERLKGFTADGLASSYNVPATKAAQMLEHAKAGRLGL